MKILMISTDRNAFSPASAVRERLGRLAGEVGSLTVIVFTLIEDNFQPVTDRQLKLIPTNSQSKFFYHWDAIRLGKSLAGFDLVTTQDPFLTGFAGLRLKKFFNIPIEMQLHTDAFSPQFASFSAQNYVYYRLAKFLLPQADGIRVVSQQVAESLARAKINLKTSPVVIPIYVDIVKLKKSQPQFNLHERYPQFKYLVLMACRLEPEKDLPLAFAVLKKVLEAKLSVGLIVTGDGGEREKLKTLAERLKIKNNIIFAGWQLDLASYYYGADVFLQTSRYEGYGLALAEAASVGLPIVSTPVGIASKLKRIKLGKTADDLAKNLLEILITEPVKNEQLIPNVDPEEYYQLVSSQWKSLV